MIAATLPVATPRAFSSCGTVPHNPKLAAALQLAEEHAIRVFPCGADKSPLTEHGFKDACSEPEQIARWFGKWPDALIGVPTGRASGLLVIDVDPDGAAWYAEHAQRLACGRVHKTPRGHHLIYQMPAGVDVRNSVGTIAAGVDVRGQGGYCIWWPAEGLPTVGELADISEPPAWLLERMLATSEGREKGAAAKPHEILEGRRNEELTRLGGKLRRDGLSGTELDAALRAANAERCKPPLPELEVTRIARSMTRYSPADDVDKATIADFLAYLPGHMYIFRPTGDLWPAASVNAKLPPMPGDDGKDIAPARWLDAHQSVEQMIWAPGKEKVIRNRLMAGGGWIERVGSSCFNLYIPPSIQDGDASKAGPWIDHVRKVYPDEAWHLLAWFAHCVQHPAEKTNHALVLGGAQGVGKDTLLEPLKYAVGPWNFTEISPPQLLGRFNGFLKSIVLRISEARDLGDIDRFKFYDHTKVFTAAPPDVLRCDEKNLREHPVLNVCRVIITTNYKADGIYLPADDRRHYVAWSDRTQDDFEPGYWQRLYQWYGSGGHGHVAAFLRQMNLADFDPKAPPPKTIAFWDMVDANRAPEDAELSDVVDSLGAPDAVTITRLAARADEQLREFLNNPRTRRQVPHRLETAGYVPVRNDTAGDGLWRVNGRRKVVYAKKVLDLRSRILAVSVLVQDGLS